jgi:integrase
LQTHEDQRSANAIRLLMLTGARRSEVLSAMWDQFDLASGVWTKPSAHTKQKKSHRVPLSAPALQLLAAMRNRRIEREEDERAAGKAVANSRFLFPGDRAGAPLTDIKKGWAAVTKRATIALWSSQPDTPAGMVVTKLRAQSQEGTVISLTECQAAAKLTGVTLPPGLTDVRVHDLRHTFASILASSGLSLPIIGALLGHTQAQTTARYAHLFDDVLRAAADRVGAVVTNTSPSPAEVIPVTMGRR